ncbi:MAG TPA: PKD domain-containing protein [Solirubrobacterales bacterium]
MGGGPARGAARAGYPAAIEGSGRIASGLGAALAAVTLLWAAVPGASARPAFVGNFSLDTIFAIDTATGQRIGEPIAVGSGLAGIAITPDGSRAYVANRDAVASRLSVIDIATNQRIGEPIVLGPDFQSIAIAPDGSRVYVASESGEEVAVIDTRTNAIVTRIDLEGTANSIAIAPSGSRIYVGERIGAVTRIKVLGADTNQPVGEPIVVSGGVQAIAITPDGSSLYATTNTDLAYAVDTATNQVRATIPVGNEPRAMAITPDGGRAYVSNADDGTVSVIDTRLNQVIGAPIPVGITSRAVAIAEGHAFVTSFGTDNIAVIDTTTNTLVGPPIEGGGKLEGIATVPDLAPTAAFSAPAARIRPGDPVSLDASASKDPDGRISTFAWAFGDGQAVTATAPATTHVFATPGTYAVTLKVTDNEFCSTSLIFTGQTASCAGSPGAAITKRVEVAYPGVQVKCPKKAKRAGCKFALQVVAKKPKPKGRAKAQSAVAKVKVKAGRSAIVSFKAKPAFRDKLARANSVVVKQTRTLAGKKTTSYRKLKIVR